MSGTLRLVVISGLSGSGKSVALHMLEDLGYFCVDNLPAGLLNTFVSHLVRHPDGLHSRAAVGLDARNREAELEAIPGLVRDLRQAAIDCDVLFLHADDESLLRRFGDTRRRHPLARPGWSLRESIAEERRLLGPVNDAADLVIDTTQTSVHQLRELIRLRVDARKTGRLSILFESFGFKHRLPADVDFVFDARTLPNPYWEERLRQLTGRDQPVIEFLDAQPEMAGFLDDVAGFIERRIPAYQEANRGYLTVAIGCTGGQHRSVYLADRLAERFGARFPGVLARHTCLEPR